MREKEHAIIMAVINLLGEASPDKKLSIANVANALDMAKSTLYEYFDSKETMLYHAVKYLIQQSIDQLMSINLASIPSFKQRFIVHMRAIYDYSQDQKMMQNILRHPEILSLPSTTHERLIEISQQALTTLQQRLSELINDGVKEGVLAAFPPKARLKSVEALILGCIIIMTDPYFKGDANRVIQDAYESILVLINTNEQLGV